MTSTWQDAAACKGMDVELFYSDDDDDIAEALSICEGCLVRSACFDHALAHGETHGVWGGARERERRRALRRLRPAARVPQRVAAASRDSDAA